MVNATASIPTRADVVAAAAWLERWIVRTPVVRSAALDRLAGAELWLKAENLQSTGSYKFRGAMLALERIAREGRRAGVIAQSTGNHALAVATAAQEYGLAATAVLPVDASPAKVRRIEATGARVLQAGTTVDERLAAVERLRLAGDHAVVDAYDHPEVIAGQGSAALELIEAARRRAAPLDAVVVPVGGGGGVAGACLAAEGRRTAVYGAEPVGNDSLAQSLEHGRRITVAPAPTLADGLRPSTVGELPFRIVSGSIAGVLRVDDRAIARALCLALFHTALLIEPSAAAGLAGAIQLAATGAHRRIGVLLTGGNTEPAVLARLLTEEDDVL